METYPKPNGPKPDDYTLARHLTQVHSRALLRAYQNDSNVIGAGFGRRTTGGQRAGPYAMVVYVMRKVPEQFLPTSVLLPRRIYSGRDYVEVDVVETGPMYPLSFTARERPAPSGISVGNGNESSAGTLGCLVTDNTDGSLCILSNNHVLARENAAVLGEQIVQQGIFDGSTSPADDIATLKRFVTIMAAGNIVDGAIAQVTNVNDVVDQMKNNLMPVPSPGHPAVGLLFAGGCSRTIMNPINTVLSQLNISFPAGAGSTAGGDIGVNVEKVGRTTEYTTSTITEIDVTVTIPYDFGNATFDRQITTAWMSDKGDSGSVVCVGGAGGDENECGCLTTSTAERISGLDLGLDEALEKEFREKYLSQTRLGRYLIDLYFRNERRLAERARSAKISESDRAFGRYLYQAYMDEARLAALQPHNPDLRLTEKHLEEARQALGRARPYLARDELAAAERLFALARQAMGKNAAEILEMLNDEELYRQVVSILSEVKFLRQPDRPDKGWK